MSRPSISLAKAVKLSSRITRDDDAIAEPLIELILGLTDSDGDAARLAIRTAVLKNLYSQTDDFNLHFHQYIGESLNDAAAMDPTVIQSSSSS